MNRYRFDVNGKIIEPNAIVRALPTNSCYPPVIPNGEYVVKDVSPIGVELNTGQFIWAHHVEVLDYKKDNNILG